MSLTEIELSALAVARAAIEGRASAYGPADAIVFALSSAQLLRSPADAAELERLMRERANTDTAVADAAEERAQLHARLSELEPYEALTPQTCERGLHLAWFVDSELQHACPWCRIAELEAGAPPSVVYRAEHCDMPIGPISVFTSREVAAAAAEDSLRRIAPTLVGTWQQSIEDDEVCELVTADYGHTSSTGHMVRRITVASSFEPEVQG